MKKFLLYESLYGEVTLTPHTPEHWNSLLERMQKDHRMSIEELRDEGVWIDGDEFYSDDATIYVDAGGRVRTIELEDGI